MERIDIFSCFIDDVKDNIAQISSINIKNEDYYMEIPCKDLKKNNIPCESGIQFRIKITINENKEKMEFIHIPRKNLTDKEIDERLEYYKEKYKDI